MIAQPMAYSGSKSGKAKEYTLVQWQKTLGWLQPLKVLSSTDTVVEWSKLRLTILKIPGSILTNTITLFETLHPRLLGREKPLKWAELHDVTTIQKKTQKGRKHSTPDCWKGGENPSSGRDFMTSQPTRIQENPKGAGLKSRDQALDQSEGWAIRGGFLLRWM